jgi:hypothetical protein
VLPVKALEVEMAWWLAALCSGKEREEEERMLASRSRSKAMS